MTRGGLCYRAFRNDERVGYATAHSGMTSAVGCATEYSGMARWLVIMDIFTNFMWWILQEAIKISSYLLSPLQRGIEGDLTGLLTTDVTGSFLTL